MAKQNANLTVLGQNAALESAFLNAPMIAAPNTTITDLAGNARQLRDPSKTLRLAIGVERISMNSFVPALDEKGPNGEFVWKSLKDDRIRFVGSGWSNLSTSSGTRPNTNVLNNYLEITFYGTGLNILMLSGTGVDQRASVDGGSEGANINTVTPSAVLNSRNYSPNVIYPVTAGLALGTHTVKIRNNVADNFNVFGFEVLNESSTIIAPQGEIISAGRKLTNASSTTTPYASGFDGNPSLNGKGGRVWVYLAPGGLGKALQQADITQLNLAAASHTNEEVIRRVSYRDFGSQRSDDFSTMTTGLDFNSFTLDDGTTTLVGANVNTAGGSTGMWPGTTNGFFTLTFVGTGLDILRSDTTGATIDSHDVVVDNTNIGTLTGAGSGTERIQKIVSGLPYGTHTVRIQRPSAVNAAVGVVDFIIYGPKQPTIPDGAIKINEYYLMGNFSANATAGVDTISRGVLRKFNTREFLYVGTWSASAAVGTDIGGWELISSTNTDYFQYTFYGTGFDFRYTTGGAATVTSTVTVDGSTNLSGFTTSSYGAGATFTAATGVISAPASSVAYGATVSGLNLGIHTVRITKTSGATNWAVQTLDIISPVHFPNTKCGSLSVAPALPFPLENLSGGTNLGEAKAWILFNSITDKVISSYNIASVLETTDLTTFILRFERPFKTEPVIVASNTSGSGIAIRAFDGDTASLNSKKLGCNITNTGGGTNFTYVVAYGELEEED